MDATDRNTPHQRRQPLAAAGSAQQATQEVLRRHATRVGRVATVVIVALPIYESREGLAAVVRGIMGGAAPVSAVPTNGKKKALV